MKKRNSSGMPQISAALGDWTTKFTLLKHTETVIEGFVKINQIPICFKGAIQPLSARAIALKPEGQRSWTWLQMHCAAHTNQLIPGDRITWRGDVYKVMESKDYGLNGYIEYHLAKDFQQGGTP